MTFQASETRSPSGVTIANDFRDNLIIDRYDPVFADMRASKIKHLRSANSEDSITWNVFRSLRQVAPHNWIPLLWRAAFPSLPVPADVLATVKLWESIPPPLGLLALGDEGDSEIDVVIESASWVWFVEAKYRSDISIGTTTRPGRDQITRNIDVGSYYAGVRPFFFSLLTVSSKHSPHGSSKLETYRDFAGVREVLRSHRPDGLKNLTGIASLHWSDLAGVLLDLQTSEAREDEKAYANRAYTWLKEKRLAGEDN